MVCKKRGIYGFLGTSWVLITVAPRNSRVCLVGENPTCSVPAL